MEEAKEKKGFKERFLNSTFVKNYKAILGAKPNSKKGYVLKATTRIAYTGVLTALATLFNVITFYPVKYLAFSLTTIPTFIAGAMLGPISGFAVGFLGDLLGWLILPQGAYMPLIGISSGLWGFIGGIVFLALNLKYPFKIIISYLICLLFCTSFLNTFNLWIVYSNGKSTFWAYLWLRIPFQVLMAAINCFLTTITYRELLKLKIVKPKRRVPKAEPVSSDGDNIG